MDLIEAYINEVLKHVPDHKKEQVRKSLSDRIYAMLAKRTRGGQATEDDIKAVLQELGNPASVAFTYSRLLNGLIYPENASFYQFLLTLVLMVAIIGKTIAAILKNIFHPENIPMQVVSFLFSTSIMCFSIFAGITLIFIVFQNKGIKMNFPSKFTWPAFGSSGKKVRNHYYIKLSDPVGGIIVGIFFLLMLNWSNDFLAGLILQGKAKSAIPLFVDMFVKILPIINASICVGIIRDCAKLIIRRWNIGLAILNIIFNGVSAVLTVALFSSPDLWNSAFIQYLTGNIFNGNSTAGYITWVFPKFIIVMVLFGLTLDSIINLVRAVRYQFTNEQL